jgi:hypothetical protein
MPMTDSLQIIDESAFSTSSIEYLKTGKSLTSIGDAAFYYCSLLKRAEICDQVTTLGEATFSNCYSLQTIDVGNGVHKIPRSFCAECSDLISVSLGSAVDTLEIKCFEECKKLITVICKAEVPPVMKSAEGTFFDTTVYQNATLYVPCESIEAYKRANIWQKFQNILGMDNLIIPGDVNGDGEVTIADANNVVDIVVMGGNSGHTRAPQADVNGDDEINIADINAIIDLIIKND